MARKEIMSVRLAPEILEELEQLSKQHDLSKGWFIQQAVKFYLEQLRARESEKWTEK